MDDPKTSVIYKDNYAKKPVSEWIALLLLYPWYYLSFTTFFLQYDCVCESCELFPIMLKKYSSCCSGVYVGFVMGHNFVF